MYPRQQGTGFSLTSKATRAMEPAFSPDGRYVYFTATNQIRRLDRRSDTDIQLTPGGKASFRPVLSPDGRWLAFGRREGAVTALRIRDLQSGAERELIRPITRDDSEGFGVQGTYPSYAFTRDGSAIIIAIAGKIQRVDVASGAASVIPMRVMVRQEVPNPVRVANKIGDGDIHVRNLRGTSFSPDGKRVVFSALGKLYIQDAAGGPARRLTIRNER